MLQAAGVFPETPVPGLVDPGVACHVGCPLSDDPVRVGASTPPVRWSRSKHGQRAAPSPGGVEPGLWLAAGGEHQQVACPGEGDVMPAGPVEVADAPTRPASRSGPLRDPTMTTSHSRPSAWWMVVTSISSPSRTRTWPAGSHRAGSHRAGSHRAGSHRAGSHRAGSHRAGSHRAGSHRAGSHRAGSHRAGSHRAGSHRAGSHRAGSHRAGSHRAGSHRAGSHRAGSHRAGMPAVSNPST